MVIASATANTLNIGIHYGIVDTHNENANWPHNIEDTVSFPLDSPCSSIIKGEKTQYNNPAIIKLKILKHDSGMKFHAISKGHTKNYGMKKIKLSKTRSGVHTYHVIGQKFQNNSTLGWTTRVDSILLYYIIKVSKFKN